MDCLLCLQSTIKKKSGRLEKFLSFARSHSIVTRGSVSLSCATTPFLLFLILPVVLNRYVGEVAFFQDISFYTSPDPAFVPKINPVPRDPEVFRIFGLLDPYVQRFFLDFSNADSTVIPISGIISNQAKNEEFWKFSTMKNFLLGPPLVRRSKNDAEEFLLFISCYRSSLNITFFFNF